MSEDSLEVELLNRQSLQLAFIKLNVKVNKMKLLEVFAIFLCVTLQFSGVFPGGSTFKDQSSSSIWLPMQSSDFSILSESLEASGIDASSENHFRSHPSKRSHADPKEDREHRGKHHEHDNNLLNLKINAGLNLNDILPGLLPNIKVKTGAKVKSPVKLPTLLKAKVKAKA